MKREKKEKEKKMRKKESGKKNQSLGKIKCGGEKKKIRERGKEKIFPVFRRSKLDNPRTKVGSCNENYA